MRKILVAVSVVVLAPFAVAACGSDDDASDTTEASASTVAGDEAGGSCLGAGDAIEGYVGLTEEEAAAKAEEDGLQLRVVGIDGACQPATMDLRDDRVNVDLVDGVVVGAAVF
jgi:hypothetical protein